MKQTDGVLIIRRNKKNKLICEVDIGAKQPMVIPAFYNIEDDPLNGKKCQVFRESGKIVKIEIDGKELPRKANESRNTTTKSGYKQSQTERKSHQLPVDSFSISETMLPKDTRSLQLMDIDNINLKLNKAARFEDEKFLFLKVNKGKVLFNFMADYSNVNFKEINTKYFRAIESMGIDIKSIRIHPDWRLIVGLGTDTVYETGITLHHIYGFPYIPGQAVKGAMRSFIITEYFDQNEGEAIKSKLFCDIFGCPEKIKIEKSNYKSHYEKAMQGKLFFFDAFPTKAPQIEADIMNPHYSDYYSGKTPPGDYLNPVPIPFLTVGEDSEFQFIIGIKPSANKKIEEYESDPLAQKLLGKGTVLRSLTVLETTNTILKTALIESGIGAKTAVGYGYFQG